MTILRRLMVAIITFMATISLSGPAMAATDPSTPEPSPQSIQSTTPPGPASTAFAGIGSADAEDGAVSAGPVIGCWIVAEHPVTLTPNSRDIIGSGEITRCTSEKPSACATTSWLYRINADAPETRVGSGPTRHSCTPGRASRSEASYRCTYHPSREFSYFTITTLTVVIRGQTVSNDAVSGNSHYWCI